MSKYTCAIYTRKSSEEGLDMDFNSLDAQREACAAYIQSQKAEGWAASPALYDDGGYSGGNLMRPALQRLLEDIKAGKVNIVVVYKIDRLTRSLMDFSKLVEIFDAHGVTFVSVTQSFNTTTSMGRLTLNVLLSFAQFEREVTGERIRDKIAASKKKGMWMGGTTPLGYSNEGKKLMPKPDEAKLVRHIYVLYADLKSVKALKAELTRLGILSPIRVSAAGHKHGGRPFSRGNLYEILKNPVYIGKVPHKTCVYDGLHEGIVDENLWQEVQDILRNNATRRIQTTQQRHMLTGLLFDEDGTAYSPTFTKKGGKQYRYYLSQNLIQYKDHPKGLIARLPANEIEQAVTSALRKNLDRFWPEENEADSAQSYVLKHHHKMPDCELVTKVVKRIILKTDSMSIALVPGGFEQLCQKYLELHIPPDTLQSTIIHEPYKAKRSSRGAVIVETNSKRRMLFDLPDEEIKRLVQGITWRDMHFAGKTMKSIAGQEGYSEAFVRQTIFKSFSTLMRYGAAA